MRQTQKRRNDQEEFKQKMIQQDLQNTVTEKEVLNSKLEYKNADLKNYALHISQRNELVRVFIEEFIRLKNAFICINNRQRACWSVC